LGAGYAARPPHQPAPAGLIPAVFFDFGVLKNFDWSIKRHEKYSVLHEFAHVLGLEHEHDRPQSRRDPICKNSKTDLKHIRQPISPQAKLSRQYDSHSITNYCLANWALDPNSDLHQNWEPAWSKGDIKALRKLYPKKH
jgi:hypothetical protein